MSLTPSDLLGRSPSSAPREKGVTLVEEPDEIIPPPVYNDDEALSPGSPQKRHRASIAGKKMTGRPPSSHSNSSTSLKQQLSGLNLRNTPNQSQNDLVDSSGPELAAQLSDPRKILSQVVEWMNHEKTKMYKRGMKRHHAKKHPAEAKGLDHHNESDALRGEVSADEDDEVSSLDQLEGILAGFLKSSQSSTPRFAPKSPALLARKGSLANLFKRSSASPIPSDTDFFGDEILVPNVETTLDNSKALAYSGGVADSEMNDRARRKNAKHWVIFKEDILRITHTLRLKGWRRIPLDRAGEIDVGRLSGALTNAVYVCKPPKNVPDVNQDGTPSRTAAQKRPPVLLLLRIYGPQVEHLIDRETELNILKRLARKKIGPRMLGTFSNGRFEEYLHARTLEAPDLRVPETSKQIAKRMRELHEGIELLDSELDAGPLTFNNWNKWVERCEKVTSWLDEQVHQQQQRPHDAVVNPQYTRLGLICGVEWPVFRETYEKYRAKMVKDYGGESALKKKLVFTHNDTQYGNLMRLKPDGESPLLQPANHHKQLVVIDFEYAGQNTAGLEFANHFTEWCYNYHHPEKPYACHTKMYPTTEEQHRFIRSYVMHRPQFNSSASTTPKMEVREKTNVPGFMLDARAPPELSNYDAEEREREERTEEEIQELLQETRLWRLANSAQWVAWGIVQAKIPELDEPPERIGSKTKTIMEKMKNGLLHTNHEVMSDPLDEEEKQTREDAKHDRPEGRLQEEAHNEGDGEEESEEFDYLAYAQERAMFFWGDAVLMGLIKEEELPESMRAMLKKVAY